MGWETVATAKKASLLGLIPQQWKINPAEVPSNATLRNVTNYICRFLHPLEVEITNSPANKILGNIRSLEWTSLDVTRAFCHRAALAHQLVCINRGIPSFLCSG
jgi:amidase